MMHTVCFNPDVSLGSKPLLSLPFNHASYMFDEMSERNPLLYSSRKCPCPCCCCYNAANMSMCNKLTAISPSFLCIGLNQSTLIQWSLTKRSIFHGNSRGFYGNGSGVSSFSDRNYYYEKLNSFNERKKHRQKGFGHKRRKQFLGNVSDDDYVNDVEVMLSLLSDEVGLDNNYVRNRKKIDKKDNICDNKEKKNVGSRMKYKEFEELSDKDNSVIDSNFNSQKLKVISEVRKPQKMLTSSLSESKMKNCEVISTEVSDTVKDINEEKHQKTDHLIEIRKVSSDKSQQISQVHVTNSENSSVSHRKSDKHKLYSETSSLKGPSDEMWHVTDASSDDIISSSSDQNGDAVKNNGRSLLTIIGDVIRFRWSSPCSESHIPISHGGKCSSSLSVSSDSNNGESKTRKVKDKFDEWEEAYGFEAKKLKEDEMFMREALLEAKKAADVAEVPVGAVLVHDGKIIARGYNLVEELCDSTAHAEMICIRKGSKILGSWRLSDTTLYVTLEPCPMCAGAILQARIGTVVWGAPNKLLGADGSWIRLFSDGNQGKDVTPTDKSPAPVHPFHQNMVVRRGVLATECAGIMKHFFRLRRNNKTKPESPIPPELESPIPPEPELPIPHGPESLIPHGPESLIPPGPDSPILPEPESPIPPSSTTVSHHHSSFFCKMQDAFKIIFCL